MPRRATAAIAPRPSRNAQEGRTCWSNREGAAGPEGRGITAHVSLPGYHSRLHAHRRASRGVAQDHGGRGAPAVKALLKDVRQERGGAASSPHRRAGRSARTSSATDGISAAPGKRCGAGRGASGRPCSSTASWGSFAAPARLLSDESRASASTTTASTSAPRTSSARSPPELASRCGRSRNPRASSRSTGSPGSSSARCARGLARSGGYLVINQTEAWWRWTSNSGRYTRQEEPRGDDPQDQRRAVSGWCGRSPARPGRHHRRGLHRHGGEEEPAEGDGRSRAGAAPRPLAVQGSFRKSSASSSSPASACGSRWSGPCASLPVLAGERDGEDGRHLCARRYTTRCGSGPDVQGAGSRVCVNPEVARPWARRNAV